MYGWLWRHLPGGRVAKALEAAVLFLAVLALLFLVVFPWAATHVPFLDVTIDPTDDAGSIYVHSVPSVGTVP